MFYIKITLHLIYHKMKISFTFKERRREMKKHKIIRTATILTLALFALSLLSTVQLANAYTFPRSSNVAMVPDNHSNNGGYLWTGTTWPDSPGFTFTALSQNSIRDDATDPIVAGGYDTVVLLASDFDFDSYWTDTDFSGRILAFVNGGGKLIIYTSERENDFSNFVYPFTIDYPGATGSLGGTLNNIADDTLSSSTSSDASFIDTSLITSQTDAVMDTNVMTSSDPHWYVDMYAINANDVGGPAHTYAFYGAGLIIYNGLDIDYGLNYDPWYPSNAAGRNAIQMVWWRELCGQELGAGQSVSGLTLTPPTATNAVDTTHTVTATVKDSINNPVPDVDVTFQIISGPNAGPTTTTVTTDENGEATFSWSSSVEGTDTVQASTINAAGAPVTTTATKTWYITPTNVIPEVPLGTLAAFAVMFVGLASFAAKGKIRKSPQLQK
jgi:hypothetical protein